MYKAKFRCLIDRAYKINNTTFGFNQDMAKLTEIQNKNVFPSHHIKRLKENYLTKVNIEPIPTSASQNIHYFKLPYVNIQNINIQNINISEHKQRKHSELLSKKINILIRKYCKDSFSRIVFTSFKSGTYFSPIMINYL